MYQECQADPLTNKMYWSDPPECVYMPPCNRDPCLNGGLCRNVDNYQFRCDCSGTRFKGLRCDVGVIEVQQPPILRVNEKVFLSASAYPTNDLHLHLMIEENGGISINSHQLTFNSLSTTALFSITAISRGIHFIHFNVSGEDMGEYEIPQSIMVIVQSSNTTNISNHTHPYYDTTEYSVLDIQSTGCCTSTVADDYLTCPNSAVINSSLLSSCEWINNTETTGIVFASRFASNEFSHIPVSIVGAYLQPYHPIISLPSSDHTCNQCNSLCQSYDLTEDDIVDLIKSHSLARTFLKYTRESLPDWVSISINSLYDNTFNSYDAIADIVYGQDIVLIEDCQNLNLVDDDLYTIIRTNTSLDILVDNDGLTYLPTQLMDVPVCFAVSLCEDRPMIHVTIPQGYQHQLENITRIKAVTDYGWSMNIFEVALSNVPRNVPSHYQLNLPSSLDDNDLMLPEYNVMMELSIDRVITQGSTSVEFSADVIAYLPQTPTTLQGALIGDIHLVVNMSFNNELASLEVIQLPGIPVPFVLPGYSSINSFWSNGAYLKFEYSPSDFDDFFSSVLPLYPSSIKHPCIANMFITFTSNHNIDRMVFTTSCTGLHVHGFHFPSDIMEHQVTIVPSEERIIIESNFSESHYQVNEYMMLNQPDEGNAISINYSTNGEVIGEITYTDLIIFGHMWSDIELSINGDSITFSTFSVNKIYKLELENIMMFGKVIESNSDLEVHITSEVNDLEFKSELENFTRTLIKNEIQIYDDRLKNLQSAKEHVQQVFYHYSDIVSELQQELNIYSTLYEELTAKIDHLTHLQAIYEHDVDQLLLNSVSDELIDILNICEMGNCSNECAINRTCDVCEYSMPFSEWLVGLVKEENYEIVTYKKNIMKQDWTVDYFCRLITNIKSWGKTAYGQTCSYKADYDDEIVRSSQWVTESKECNTSHYRSIHSIEDHSLIIDNICLSTDCGMYLQSSDCVVSDSACNVAQLKLIEYLPIGKQNQLNSLKDLIQVRSNLSVAMTKAELYRYKRDSAECRVNFTHSILLSLYNQLSQLDDSYNAFITDNIYIQEIKALLLNYSIEDFFVVKGISFDVIINENSTSTFPLLIEYEVNALNMTNELLVPLDFKSSRSIVKRDISLAVLKNLETMLSTSNRKRRSCDVIEPSANEHHFEEYCARINSVKGYLIEVNQSLNAMDDYTMETIEQLEYPVQYDLVDIKDELLSVDINLLNSHLDTPTTMDDLLQSAFNSQEYIKLVETLENMKNTTQGISSLIENTSVDISWWVAMNALHLTSYNRMIDNRKCYGFGDCLKVIMVILNEVINDYPFNDDIQVVDSAILTLADENILKIAEMNFKVALNSSIWTLMEPLYSITIDVDKNTNWCSESPEFTQQPEEVVYVEMRSNTELVCKGSNDVVHQWYKNGFPIFESNIQTLRLEDVDVKDEGQYHCTISNNIGTSLSVVSNVLAYISPRIIYSPTNQTTYEGNEDDAVFICNATGYPTPVYNWYYSIDKVNWELIGNGSNELVVYKPTQSNEGWYRCRASIYDHVTDPSDEAYLHIVGASISKISHIIEFQMAIYSTDDVYQFHNNHFWNGLHKTIENTIRRNEEWVYGYIENLKTEINPETNQLEISLYLSTHYEYSVDMKRIVDQAKEANQQNMELLDILENLNLRLQESSISFEYNGDFFYAFPKTFAISDTIYRCEEGKEIMKNSFICLNCSVGHRSEIVNNIPRCIECERGTYNGLIGQGVCTRCRQSTSTLKTGLVTDDKCKDQCGPNFYSTDGITNCTECPIGEYGQFDYGSTTCIPCSSNDRSNETFIRCYESPPQRIPMIVNKGLRQIMLYTGIVSTLVILGVLSVLLIVFIFGFHKLKVKINKKTGTDFGVSTGDKGRQQPEIALTDLDRPLFQNSSHANPMFGLPVGPNSAYDEVVRDNPFYMGVEDVVPQKENTDTEYPLTSEWLKQKETKMRNLKAKFEPNTAADPNMFMISGNHDDEQENEYTLATDDHEEKDTESELSEERGNHYSTIPNDVDPEPLHFLFNSRQNLYDVVQ